MSDHTQEPDSTPPGGLPCQGLYDPHEAPDDSRWYPNTSASVQLALCLESCKQINEFRSVLVKGGITRRRLTLLATPIHNLVTHVVKLARDLKTADRAHWPELDRQNLTALHGILEERLKGPLRIIRNKRSAHTDASALRSPKVPESSAGSILRPLGEAASLLILCLNHEAVFGYYRLPDPKQTEEVEVFMQYPIATRLRLGPDARLKEIVEFRLEADPRHEAAATVCETIEFYNELAPGASLQSIQLNRFERPRLKNPMHVRLL